METADVVIAGGGISGCALAYQLAKRKVDVLLLERETLGSQSTGTATSHSIAEGAEGSGSALKVRSASVEQLPRETRSSTYVVLLGMPALQQVQAQPEP